MLPDALGERTASEHVTSCGTGGHHDCTLQSWNQSVGNDNGDKMEAIWTGQLMTLGTSVVAGGSAGRPPSMRQSA